MTFFVMLIEGRSKFLQTYNRIRENDRTNMSLEGTRFTLASKKKFENNSLLVTADVGKSKKPVNTIPDITFGIKSPLDKEGAKEVTFTWKSHERNADAVPPRDFMKLNKMTLKDKAIDGKAVNQFRKSHDARTISVQKKKPRSALPSEVDPNFTYGITVKYGETAKELVENLYEEDWVKQKEDEYQKKVDKKVQKIQKEKSKAAANIKGARSISPEPKKPMNPFYDSPASEPILKSTTNQPTFNSEPFKMTKFKNVPSKVETRRIPVE
jgi:hypothetical protein